MIPKLSVIFKTRTIIGTLISLIYFLEPKPEVICKNQELSNIDIFLILGLA
jgi:hypothetical protein